MATIGRQAANIVRVGEVTDQGAVLPMRRNLDQWLALYRHHHGLMADMTSFGRLVPELARLIDEMGRLLGELQALPDDCDDIRHPMVEACGQRMLGLFFAIHADASQSEPVPALDIADARFLAVWFYFCVSLPCLLLYGTSPTALLRRARHGDLVAVGRLLLLDRNVIFEPSVSRAIHADPAGWTLVRAKLPARIPRIRPLRWKVMAAATTRTIADACKYPLTHRAIADLYHALARDCDGSVDDRDVNSLQGRSFERQVAATLQQGTSLLNLETDAACRASVAVNEQVSRERICSSRKGS